MRDKNIDFCKGGSRARLKNALVLSVPVTGTSRENNRGCARAGKRKPGKMAVHERVRDVPTGEVVPRDDREQGIGAAVRRYVPQRARG